MNDPERLDLPSASNFSIVANCPGAPELIRSLPKDRVIELADESTERGLRIHHAWQTGDTSQLSEDELEDYNKTLELAEQSKNQWLKDHKLAAVTTLKEQRLWYHDAETLQPLTSGQYDDLLLHDGGPFSGHAHVRDLKSGWCKNLTPSEQSWQLRLLAVLVWIEYGEQWNLTTVRASFLKPKFYRTAIDTVEYNLSDLARAKTSIDQAIWESQQPYAPRRPGAHCTYCPGKAHCPEAQLYAMIPGGNINDKEYIEVAVEVATPEMIAAVHRRSKVITKVLDAVKARLKAMPKDQLESLGFKLSEGKKLDPITNTREAFSKLINADTTWIDGVWASMKFGKTELVEQYRLAHPGVTTKDVEEYLFKKLLVDCIEPKKSDGSLEEL